MRNAKLDKAPLLPKNYDPQPLNSNFLTYKHHQNFNIKPEMDYCVLLMRTAQRFHFPSWLNWKCQNLREL